ncbi:MAG: amylo-alpha-1,6-glucosidase [Candidatus Woesearchaeota archaeon]
MSLLVSNCNGSFALFGIKSRYQGVFFKQQNDVYKTIAHIDVKGAPGSILNEFWKVTRDRDGAQESFWFAKNLPVFFYELPSKAEILFDCKRNFDNRQWGRNYEFFSEDKALLVHFQKKNDLREPAEGEYSFWLALYGCEFEKLQQWEEHFYEYDELRNSPPFSRWVLRGCRTHGSFTMAFSPSKSEALKLAKSSWAKRKQLAAEAEKYALDCIVGGDIKNGEMRAAAECARYSLACLRENHGLYAGIPWFHQRWARDELISVKALLHSHQHTLAKVILFSWLEKLLPGGKLPGTLTSTIADTGWLFLRFENYLCELKKKEKEWLLGKLEAYLSEVEKNLKNGLVVNGARETWMDSIDRSNARIEIQALTLAACRLYRHLKSEHPLEHKLKSRVKELFWKSGHLSDGVDDDTVRPNVFIAAYAYPELLSKREWLHCFDYVLPKLWCDWGGLATLDKSHPSFVAEHTGENPKSYHSGDSWYWINNLAALVLFAFDKKKYRPYIQHILKASTKEILYEGVCGHHAELSSAAAFKSQGCLAQAWSAAMYIELVEELFG